MLVVGLLVGVGTYTLVPAKAITPFTYDTPIHVEEVEGGVLFTARRCNNTSKELDVTVTAFWESDTTAIQPIPFQPVASGLAKVPVGCTSPESAMPQKTDYLSVGRWRARGSVCIVNGACSGWYSPYIQVSR